MILSTTPQIEGHTIREYKGIVTGETIIGANMFKDLFAGIRDIVGGRAGAYEGRFCCPTLWHLSCQTCFIF